MITHQPRSNNFPDNLLKFRFSMLISLTAKCNSPISIFAKSLYRIMSVFLKKVQLFLNSINKDLKNMVKCALDKSKQQSWLTWFEVGSNGLAKLMLNTLWSTLKVFDDIINQYYNPTKRKINILRENFVMIRFGLCNRQIVHSYRYSPRHYSDINNNHWLIYSSIQTFIWLLIFNWYFWHRKCVCYPLNTFNSFYQSKKFLFFKLIYDGVFFICCLI